MIGLCGVDLDNELVAVDRGPLKGHHTKLTYPPAMSPNGARAAPPGGIIVPEAHVQ